VARGAATSAWTRRRTWRRFPHLLSDVASLSRRHLPNAITHLFLPPRWQTNTSWVAWRTLLLWRGAALRRRCGL